VRGPRAPALARLRGVDVAQSCTALGLFTVNV
jgi:hypothetical protein